MPSAQGQLEQTARSRHYTGIIVSIVTVPYCLHQGVGPTVVARGYDEVHEFEVDVIESSSDPSGLGDFFIGGLISFPIHLVMLISN